MPVTVLWRPGTKRAPLSLFARVVYKISLTKVDLPDPETPVTDTKTPSGTSTSISLRLFSFAPLTTSLRLGSIARRFAGISIDLRPDKYAPVIDSLDAIKSS